MSHIYDRFFSGREASSSTPPSTMAQMATAVAEQPRGGPRLDDLLSGLAIFEAHAAGDGEALDALLEGQSAGEALHSTLYATELLVEVLNIESRFDLDSIISSLRRQVIKHQAGHEPGESCAD